jgi:D-alanyl-D-alanine carboxypeptidase
MGQRNFSHFLCVYTISSGVPLALLFLTSCTNTSRSRPDILRESPCTIRKALQWRFSDHSQWAALAVNTSTGEPLYSLNADIPLMPGSTVKLITTAAALQILGPDYTLDPKLLVPRINANGTYNRC